MPDLAVVKALLDRPSPKSLGMLGLVVESTGGADGRLRTDGILGSQAGPVEREELADLIEAGSALAVDGLEVRRIRDDPMAALWVGDDFAAASENCGLSLPPLPKSRRGQASGGTYWVSSAAHVHRVLDTWVARAFRRVARTEDHHLATLLSWAAPDQDEARGGVVNRGQPREARARLDVVGPPGDWRASDRSAGRPGGPLPSVGSSCLRPPTGGHRVHRFGQGRGRGNRGFRRESPRHSHCELREVAEGPAPCGRAGADAAPTPAARQTGARRLGPARLLP